MQIQNSNEKETAATLSCTTISLDVWFSQTLLLQIFQHHRDRLARAVASHPLCPGLGLLKRTLPSKQNLRRSVRHTNQKVQRTTLSGFELEHFLHNIPRTHCAPRSSSEATVDTTPKKSLPQSIKELS